MLWVYAAALGALALLGLGALAFSWHVRTERVIRDWANKEIESGEEAVRLLGGPERAAGRLGFHLRLPERFAEERPKAAELLGFCGRPAIPALVRALGDEDRHVLESAAQAFGLIGREAVPALIAALGCIGPAAAPAVPRLIELLDVEDFETSIDFSAVKALGRIGPAAASAVPEIVPWLRGTRGREAGSRAAAAEALGGIGPAATAALPLIRTKLNVETDGLDYESWDEVRIELAVVLWRITGDGREALPELAKHCPAHGLIWRECPPPNLFVVSHGEEHPLAFNEDSNPPAVKSLLALGPERLAAAGDGTGIRLCGDLDDPLDEGLAYALAIKRQQDRDRREGTASPPIPRNRVTRRLLGWSFAEAAGAKKR